LLLEITGIPEHIKRVRIFKAIYGNSQRQTYRRIITEKDNENKVYSLLS